MGAHGMITLVAAPNRYAPTLSHGREAEAGRIRAESRGLGEPNLVATRSRPGQAGCPARPGIDRARGRSVGVGADDFAPAPSSQAPPRLLTDGVFDEPDRAVTHAHVHPAGVVAV